MKGNIPSQLEEGLRLLLLSFFSNHVSEYINLISHTSQKLKRRVSLYSAKYYGYYIFNNFKIWTHVKNTLEHKLTLD